MAACLCVLACGGPVLKEGDACTNEKMTCQDTQTALECRCISLDAERDCLAKGVVALPCRGPDGCRREGGHIACDMSLNVVGDLCASVTEGEGICSPDGKAILECRQGAFLQSNTCSQCTVDNGTLNCQP